MVTKDCYTIVHSAEHTSLILNEILNEKMKDCSEKAQVNGKLV